MDEKHGGMPFETSVGGCMELNSLQPTIIRYPYSSFQGYGVMEELFWRNGHASVKVGVGRLVKLDKVCGE